MNLNHPFLYAYKTQKTRSLRSVLLSQYITGILACSSAVLIVVIMETESCVLPTIDVENENQIDYACHDHPLTLCEIDEACSICLETCLGGRTYGCNECGLFLHESCTKIEIPQEIDHYFHPHRLRLAMKESKHLDCSCIACFNRLLGLMFECRDCEVYMDVQCALLPNKLKQDGCIDHIQHVEHAHPLILCDDEKKYENKLCRGCGGGLVTRSCLSYDTLLLLEGSESIYGCLHLQCGLFLHERCARLPPKIESPFHPGHSLELVWSVKNRKCQGCDRPHANNTYECRGSCKFILGAECAFLTPPILKFEDHNHLLTLFPSINPILHCRICYMTCGMSKIFRCIDCKYNIHLHCGPLPCSIKDKCHIHPLKLMYAFVEDGYEDDTVYCDACEQPRNPDECVYYCKDCNFIAELKCVEGEVLRSLNGERGNVKLRTANKTRIRVGAKLIRYVMTDNVETDNVETDSDNETDDIDAKYLEVKLHENFLSGCYTDEECEQLIEIFKKARVQLHPLAWTLQKSNMALCAHIKWKAELQSKGKQEFETSLLNATTKPYSDVYKQLMSLFYYSSDEEFDNGENATTEPYSDDFKQLMRDLDSYYADDDLLEVFFRGEYEIVRIGEHKIVQHSASVLKGLLHKYGDFTAKSKLSERLKTVFLTMFCEVVYTMCLTNVRKIHQRVLQKWWKALKLAQYAGFEIEFAIVQLHKVLQATFGMQAIKSYREMKSEADKISNEIEEEEAELEAKKRELEAKKIRLQELKSHVDERKYGIEYQSSPILRECLKRVSELKWKNAWDGSPIMFS